MKVMPNRLSTRSGHQQDKLTKTFVTEIASLYMQEPTVRSWIESMRTDEKPLVAISKGHITWGTSVDDKFPDAEQYVTFLFCEGTSEKAIIRHPRPKVLAA